MWPDTFVINYRLRLIKDTKLTAYRKRTTYQERRKIFSMSTV